MEDIEIAGRRLRKPNFHSQRGARLIETLSKEKMKRLLRVTGMVGSRSSVAHRSVADLR